MSDIPTAELTQLLGDLELASRDQLRALAAGVRRLARGLPLLDALWIDALRRSGAVTPFQAAEIIAGRGRQLAVGRYVLSQPVADFGYARSYAARSTAGDEAVSLSVARINAADEQRLARRVAEITEQCKKIDLPGILAWRDAGIDGNRLWATCRLIDAGTAAEWMVHNGRFPPAAVLDIARQLTAALVALEEQALTHGDISPRQLLIDRRGRAWLPAPSLRALLRPEEGHLAADLPPEAYDYLAPERVRDGSPPTVASDMFACGCLWWHMLAGRAPFAGGTAAAKLRAVEPGRLPELDRYVRDVPAGLVAAIAACTQAESDRRPVSMASLANMLGSGERRRSRANICGVWATYRRVASTGRARPVGWGRVGLAAAAGCLVCLPLVLWPLVREHVGGRAATPSSEDRQSGAGEYANESRVEWARYEVPISPNREADHVPAALELPGGSWTLSELPLAAGQTVRGRGGQRPLVNVDAGGLLVDVENVHFENIDFIWDRGGSGGPPPSAIIRLEAAAAKFTGCTFQALDDESAAPVAIRVAGPPNGDQTIETLPTAKVQVTDCVFSGMAACVELAMPAALVLAIDNSLHLGPGTMLQLTTAPPPDQPVSVALRRFTLRGAESLLTCRYGPMEVSTGQIVLESTDCVFAPVAGGALIVLEGEQKPAELLAGVHWSGQGSLMSQTASLVLWRDGHGATHPADDEAVDVDGLVRGEIEFAAAATAGPSASRVVRWQAPLFSTEPPGVHPLPIALPPRKLPAMDDSE